MLLAAALAVAAFEAPPSLRRLLPRSLEADELRVGRTIVPTLARRWESRPAFRAARERMFAAGLYPGVDYVIEASDGDAVTVRPEYPLVAKLERADWPVRVDVALSPRWMDPAAYNVLVAGFGLALAAGLLAGGLLLSATLTLSVINSSSMEPTIAPRDVLLVEKVTPRLGAPPPRGGLVFFSPPAGLRAIVAEREGAAGEGARAGRLYVKRVAALPGDRVSVDAGGQARVGGAPVGAGSERLARQRLLRAADEYAVPAGELVVLGDNADVSIDSRCWGALPRADVVGRPLLRVLPPGRFGMVR